MDYNDADRSGGVLRHDDNPGTGDKVGEAVGGVSGVVTGAAIGSAAGPIGTIVGGIAGAVGGWWAGRTVAEAASRFNDHDDNNYRQAYETRSDRLADRSYEDVRPAYQLGHLASENPDYNGKNFEAIESDLQRGWTNDLRARHGDWSAVRPFAQEAYTSRTSVTSREAMNTIENSSENLADRASDTTRSAANRAIDAVDNVKDRIDGNPASIPGPDPTDRRF
ncbi:MAG TPA: hypothetical protein VHM24_12525 [Gemmatimonadaceae bacterium]|nr:hypothetical protein [Gemmatimonadaceae bacterium]